LSSFNKQLENQRLDLFLEPQNNPMIAHVKKQCIFDSIKTLPGFLLLIHACSLTIVTLCILKETLFNQYCRKTFANIVAQTSGFINHLSLRGMGA